MNEMIPAAGKETSGKRHPRTTPILYYYYPLQLQGQSSVLVFL
jgi:hypothetical protein